MEIGLLFSLTSGRTVLDADCFAVTMVMAMVMVCVIPSEDKIRLAKEISLSSSDSTEGAEFP